MSPSAWKPVDEKMLKISGAPPAPAGGWSPVPDDFSPSPDMKPGFTRRLFSNLFEDLGGIIPGIPKAISGAVHDPLGSASKVMHSILPQTYDIEQPSTVDPAKATAGIIESTAPLVVHGAGNLLKSGAPRMAELAGRVTKYDRAFDANPGRAIITETSGITPKTISRQLRDKSIDLGDTMNRSAHEVSMDGMEADLRPALAAADQRLGRYMGSGATDLVKAIKPMRDYLGGEAPEGYAGQTYSQGRKEYISHTQTPEQVLRMRQDFAPNFQVQYRDNMPTAVDETGRAIVRALSDEVKRTVPGAEDIDPRFHDIIAAKRPMESTARNADFFQRSAQRIGAHTGALAAGLMGYQHFGLPGLAAGLILPELAVSPTSEMLAARTMNGLGRVMQKPLVTIPATLGSKAAANQR